MKTKISAKIFVTLLVAFILVLGISMKVNIDAQFNTYDEMLRLTFQDSYYTQQMSDLLGVKEGQPSDIKELEKTIRSKEFEKQVHALVGSSEVFTYFIESNGNGSTILKAINPYCFENNMISFLGSEELYSIENMPIKQRKKLYDYIVYKTNEGYKEYYPIPYNVEVEFSAYENEIVYLNWEGGSYGKPLDTVETMTIGSAMIDNQLLLHNYHSLSLFELNNEDLKEFISSYSLYGSSDIGEFSSQSEHENGVSYYISTFSLTANEGIDTVGDNLYIVTITAMSSVYQYIIDEYIYDNLLLFIGSFILVVIISSVFSYAVSHKIKKLENVTLKIANQDFDEEVMIKSNDEIGSLARSIETMRVQLKDTISKLEDEIQKVKELEGLRKDFVNQFTHEMKTPLGIINGYSELIEEADNEDDVKKYLEIINRETKRINQLVQSMLSLSRLEAGKVDIQKNDIDLEELVTEILDEYEVLLMKKNIKVEVKSVSSMIYADEKLMNTVLHNFISNAIKHTYEDGRIVITLDNGCYVYNEGKQIECDQLSRIWHTFVTNDQEGSGLGLAICRSIFELHDLSYGVKNVDNGVEFYFSSYEK